MKLSKSEYQKQWRSKNPDYHKNWLSENKDYQKNWLAKNPNYQKAYRLNLENRANILIGAAKNRCKKRNAVVSITMDWIISKLKNGVCEISGLNFNLEAPTKTKNNLYAPSLDRIDSLNPNYTPENTKVVIWGVNRLHGDDSLDSVIPILKAVLANHKS